jgi:pyroglutamyl-peptidase
MPTRKNPRAPGAILLTGFEPFAGDRANPSMALLATLDGATIGRHRVVTRLLPVVFADALTGLAQALEETEPALVLALGLAGGRARLSLERVALNLIDARIPDNAGAQPTDVPVIAGAPDAYFSTLPVKAMLRAMHDAGIPAELSLSAGTYVCNALFFALRHLLESRSPPVRGGFMHLPYLPAQAALHAGAASLSLETQRAGVEAALLAALTTDNDITQSGGTIC